MQVAGGGGGGRSDDVEWGGKWQLAVGVHKEIKDQAVLLLLSWNTSDPIL
jgi:hypothetical protein